MREFAYADQFGCGANGDAIDALLTREVPIRYGGQQRNEYGVGRGASFHSGKLAEVSGMGECRASTTTTCPSVHVTEYGTSRRGVVLPVDHQAFAHVTGNLAVANHDRDTC